MEDQKTLYICPDCGGKIAFDPGEQMSYNSPGVPEGYYCTSNECDYENQEAPKTPGVCHNLIEVAEFAHYQGVGNVADAEQAEKISKRACYKYTNSGVIFSATPNGIQLTPYAEGFDGEIPPLFLEYPFTVEKYQATLKKADKAGCHVWTCVNQHDESCDCYMHY